MTNQINELDNDSYLLDLKPCLLMEESGNFESNSGTAEDALELIVKDEYVQPPSPSERNETYNSCPGSEMIELIQQSQQLMVSHSTSPSEKMEIVESTTEQYEEEPCSVFHAVNVTPADNEDG